MSKVSFDGVAKMININIGIVELDVERDIYSSWKEWILLSDNAKYLPAFRTFGGDPTSATQTAPKYFFLLNDWKVVVDSGDAVIIQSNLYTENGSSPYIVLNNSSISATNSDAQLILTGEGAGITKQDVRDAMKLGLSDEDGIEIGSIEQIIKRLDINTQS